ncbi:MAG TPA: SAM-dependent methyltransferase [Parachlamydiales bacterium]|nr:SAM-dependent methyltransferase [Parachlamydiales bacterium]
MQVSEAFFLPNILDGEDKTSAFLNCIRKNYRHVRKWAKRTSTNCFRIYDRQMHHYPLAIDFYAGRYCIQYFSMHRDYPDPPESLVEEVEKGLHSLLGADPQLIYWRNRVRRAKTQQYEKADEAKEFFPVLEYGVQFQINLLDYLDTGLFLDHRETRHLVALASKGKRVLNLFAYTCSFSVHAAMSGALFTKSVDMSNTYTDWGRENFLLNNLPLRTNPIVRADCLKFLDEEILSKTTYDLIVIDPPTISRSKKMDQMFDIQLDYPTLISKALQLLSANGVIFFSTNSRKFVFDQSLFPGCSIQDISKQTLPIDFHDPRIHFCWKIFRKDV